MGLGLDQRCVVGDVEVYRCGRKRGGEQKQKTEVDTEADVRRDGEIHDRTSDLSIVLSSSSPSSTSPLPDSRMRLDWASTEF